jgi:hypothetical protein
MSHPLDGVTQTENDSARLTIGRRPSRSGRCGCPLRAQNSPAKARSVNGRPSGSARNMNAPGEPPGALAGLLVANAESDRSIPRKKEWRDVANHNPWRFRPSATATPDLHPFCRSRACTRRACPRVEHISNNPGLTRVRPEPVQALFLDVRPVGFMAALKCWNGLLLRRLGLMVPGTCTLLPTR